MIRERCWCCNWSDKLEVVSDLKENLVLINAVNPGFILQNFLGLTDKLYHLEILVVFCFSFLQ